MELIFLAALTAFIIYKLFHVLGKEDENLKKFTHIEPIVDTIKKCAKQVKNVEFEIISLKEANLDPKVKKVCEKIIIEENEFSINKFLNGAKQAFKMILAALNNDETETLKKLLEKKLYEKFTDEIAKRKEKKINYDVTLIGIKDVKIIDANIKNNIINIKVEIHSEQIIQVTDDNKNIISGNPNNILQIFDIWSFSKKIKSGNLWLLTETTSK